MKRALVAILGMMMAASASAQVDLTNVQFGDASSNIYETRILRTAPVKQVTCTAGSTCTLLSIPSGSGDVVHIGFSAAAISGGSAATVNDGTITITVDGSVVLAAPTGIVFGTYGNGTPSSATTTQLVTSPKFQLTRVSNYAFAGAVNWVIPYTTSILITWTNNDSVSDYIWSNVDYYSGTAPAGLYPTQWGSFHSYYVPISTTLAQYASLTILPTVSAVGAIESVQLFEQSTTVSTPSWLEGEPVLTLDGNAYTYNGTEDLACGSFFFALQSGNISGSCGASIASTRSGSGYYTGMFRFFDPGQFGTDNRTAFFGTSATLTITNGVSGISSPAPGTINVASLVTYYTNP